MGESYWQQVKSFASSTLYQFHTSPGNTPLQTIEFQGHIIHLKREDLNPSGSVKDRGIAYQLASLIPQGHRHFVLSSSGNAAISAATFCQEAQVQLTVFISPHADQSKLAQIQNMQVEIMQDPRPISAAFRFAKQHNAYNLRPSLDELGPVGFQTLGTELADQLPSGIGVIFTPVSSGTTVVGMWNGFSAKPMQPPQLHIVQTSNYHPIASEYDTDFQIETTNLASGLVAKSIPRKLQIKQLISQSSGTGWVVSNQQMQATFELLHQHRIPIYYEAAATLSAYKKALDHGYQFPSGPVVCILSGKDRT